MKVVVIGVGFLGLVILKYFVFVYIFFGIEFIEILLFESEDIIGGIF